MIDSYLLMNSGLGKTMQIINIACIRKQTKGYKHCLIICGVNGLKWNWRNEIEKHSNEKGYILGTRYDKREKKKIGSMDDRLEDLIGIENAYKRQKIGLMDGLCTGCETHYTSLRSGTSRACDSKLEINTTIKKIHT